jgi:hypothetical protein
MTRRGGLGRPAPRLEMTMKTPTLALLVAASLAFAGCSDVTFYEPGVYKGASDPLVEDLRSDELRSSLDERQRKQMDR